MRQIIIDFGMLPLLDSEFALRVYGYGLMMVLGFISAIYLARWRARRMGENHDTMVYVGLLSLVGGIFGARLAYVIQHWEDFSHQSMGSLLDITSGGLIYYGGLGLGTVFVAIYLLIKRLPVRRFLDLLAPSLMLGLCFGRLGCLLNGCCFGGPCDTHFAFGAEFPMYSQPLVKFDGSKGPFSAATNEPSPVYAHQMAARNKSQSHVQPDPRLLLIRNGDIITQPHLPRHLHGALRNDQLQVMIGSEDDARKLFDAVATGGRLDEEQWHKALDKDPNGFLRGSEAWDEASQFASVQNRHGQPALTFEDAWNHLQSRRVWLSRLFDLNDPSEYAKANAYLQADLFAIAAAEKARPVLPSQALGAIGAFLLALLLALFTRLRSREGQVFAMMMILYPIVRFLEELIRADNPHDLGKLILTHNQYTSLAIFLGGIALMALLQRRPPSAGPTWAQRLAGQEPSPAKRNLKGTPA